MRRFKHTNTLGRDYYVHRVQCADGRFRYVMRTCADGALAKLPPAHEVRENVHGRVTVRRERPPMITPLEQKLLRTALERERPVAYRLDIDARAATVYASADDRKCFLESLDAEFAEGFADALSKALSQRYPPELVQMFRDRQKQRGQRRLQYYPLLRFLLVDRRHRRFAVERVCFSGESSWLRLEVLPLGPALAKYLPHLGRDSFFDLL